MIKVNVLYSLMGCPYCRTASLAVIHANLTLPLNKRITIIEVLPQEINGRAIGDPRLAFLAELNKNPSIQEWGFPVLVLEDEKVMQRFGTSMKKMTNRVVMHSAYSHDHYVTFLKQYLERRW